MKTTRLFRSFLLCALSWLILPATVHADLFGTGTNQFALDFVNSGHAGNAADSTGYGAVAYQYRIGRTEVSIDQFFKARAADNRIGDGNEDYTGTMAHAQWA